MSDKYSRYNQRLAVGEFGTTIAHALHSAGQRVSNDALETTDNIVQAVLVMNQYFHHSRRRRYYHHYHQHHQQEGLASTYGYYRYQNTNSGSSRASPSSESVSGETPPAYCESLSTYNEPPPPYTETADNGELSVDLADQGFPPAYVGPSAPDYAEPNSASSKSPPAYAAQMPSCGASSPPNDTESLQVRCECRLPSTRYRSPLVYDEKALSAYVCPQCHHATTISHNGGFLVALGTNRLIKGFPPAYVRPAPLSLASVEETLVDQGAPPAYVGPAPLSVDLAEIALVDQGFPPAYVEPAPSYAESTSASSKSRKL